MSYSNSLHSLRAGNNVPGYRISVGGASKKPFSVSEKCGSERQTAVSEKKIFFLHPKCVEIHYSRRNVVMKTSVSQ